MIYSSHSFSISQFSSITKWQIWLAKSLSNGGNFVHNINGNPNSSWENKLFFLNLYKLQNLYILMDFYLVFSRGVCARSFWPNGHSVKYPSNFICWVGFVTPYTLDPTRSSLNIILWKQFGTSSIWICAKIHEWWELSKKYVQKRKLKANFLKIKTTFSQGAKGSFGVVWRTT